MQVVVVVAIQIGAVGLLEARERLLNEIGVGTKPEIAVDSQGKPHVAFMTEDFQGAVFHATLDGGARCAPRA